MIAFRVFEAGYPYLMKNEKAPTKKRRCANSQNHMKDI